jgi:hypothetical protein
MLVCPRCHRANPSESAFCHFDGFELRTSHSPDDRQSPSRLPHAFVFPSGRRCNTFDELAHGCQEEWEVACDLLRQGVFRQFLTSAGRMDLAQAAQESKAQADPDIALDTFLGSLPATIEQGPRLDLNPRRLNLGTLHVGETRQVRLTVVNEGKGLLHGSLAVAEGSTWLRLGKGNSEKSNGECLIKTAHEQEIVLRIDTRGLSAPHKYSAKLTVITNGGIVEVPVRLDLAIYPFPKPPFQGAANPREMAERMRTQPKPAVPLLEGGEVARWFAVNGWTYPVLGPTAKGVAAVQQFFEGMGLSKPPPVALSDAQVSLSCFAGETAAGQITLRTEAKKWVYARVESDAPWLRMLTPNVSGPQQAVIAFEADSRNLPTDREHEASVKILANAGQTLEARMRLEVRRQVKTVTPRVARPFLVGALAGLVGRLLLALPADLYARVLASGSGDPVPAGSFASWLASPVSNGGFVRHFVLATWWLGAVLGALVLWRRGSNKGDVVCGAIVGAVAGLAGSATFACILPGLDLVPRLLWQEFAAAVGWTEYTGSAWLWTPAWIVLALAWWTLLGALVGFVLGIAGSRGARLLGHVGGVLSWVLRLFGLKRTAAYLGLP